MRTQILDRLVIFQLGFSLWSGRKKLRPEDLKNVQGTLPPDKLASLGSKKVMSPKALTIFNTIKARAERALDQRGVKFLGGWAIPAHLAKDALDEVRKHIDEFYREKTRFLADYDQAVEDWCLENPGWETIIRASVEPATSVANKLQAGYSAFRVNAPEPEPATEVGGEKVAESTINNGLENAIGGLGDQLFHEIAVDARQLWTSSFSGKTECTRKVLRPFGRMMDKLRGLSFIDGRVAPIIQAIVDTLSTIGKSSPVLGKDFTALTGLILILSDPEKMKEHGQAVLDGQPADLEWIQPVDVQAELFNDDTEATPQPASEKLATPVADTSPEVEVNPYDPAPIYSDLDEVGIEGADAAVLQDSEPERSVDPLPKTPDQKSTPAANVTTFAPAKETPAIEDADGFAPPPFLEDLEQILLEPEPAVSTDGIDAAASSPETTPPMTEPPVVTSTDHVAPTYPADHWF